MKATLKIYWELNHQGECASEPAHTWQLTSTVLDECQLSIQHQGAPQRQILSSPYYSNSFEGFQDN